MSLWVDPSITQRRSRSRVRRLPGGHIKRCSNSTVREYIARPRTPSNSNNGVGAMDFSSGRGDNSFKSEMSRGSRIPERGVKNLSDRFGEYRTPRKGGRNLSDRFGGYRTLGKGGKNFNSDSSARSRTSSKNFNSEGFGRSKTRFNTFETRSSRSRTSQTVSKYRSGNLISGSNFRSTSEMNRDWKVIRSLPARQSIQVTIPCDAEPGPDVSSSPPIREQLQNTGQVLPRATARFVSCNSFGEGLMVTIPQEIESHPKQSHTNVVNWPSPEKEQDARPSFLYNTPVIEQHYQHGVSYPPAPYNLPHLQTAYELFMNQTHLF